MNNLLQEKRKSGFGKFFGYLIVFFALLFAGVLFTATTWMVWGLEEALPGLEVRLQKGQIKPFEGRVELTGLAFLQKGKPVLQMSKLAVDISLKSLIKKQLIVDRILLYKGGIWLKELENGGWRVAGVDLPMAKEASTNSTADTPSSQPETPFVIDDLGVGFRGILLSQLTFHVEELKRQKSVVLKRLQITNPGLLHSASQLGLILEVALDKAALGLYGQATPFAPDIEFKGHLDVDKFSLATPKEYVSSIPPSLEGLVSSNLDLDLSYSKTDTSNFIVNGTLKLAGLKIEQDELALQLPLTIFKGKVLAYLPKATEPTGTIEGELTTQNGAFNMVGEKPMDGAIKDFSFMGKLNPKGGQGKVILTGVNGSAFVAPNKKGLMAFNELLLNELQFGSEKNVAIKEVKLGELNVQVTGEEKPLLALEEIDLQQLQYTPQGRLTLDAVTVTNSQVHVHRAGDGSWPWSANETKTTPPATTEKVTIPEDIKKADEKSVTDKVATETAVDETVEKSALSYSLGSLTFPKGISLTFNDEGVEPRVLLKGSIDTLQLGPIDSESPEKNTMFKINGSVGEYGKFDFAGSAKPLNEAKDLIVKGAIKAIDLTQYSSYVVPELGYNIKSGSLDISTDTNIADNKIAGKNNLMLKMFQLVSAKGNKSKEINKKLPMPMDAALDILRNKNGDIKMAVPVTGSLDSPNVDFSEAINKVLGAVSVKAAKTTAIVALGPVGLALAAAEMVGSAAIDSAENSYLKPVNFDAGSSELKIEAKKKLDDMAAYLSTKQQQRITACGLVVLKDQLVIAKLIGKTLKANKSNSTAEVQTAPPPQTNAPDKLVKKKYYTVRVASFKSITMANKSHDNWQKRGHKVLIRELIGKGGIKWHAVSIGQLATSKEARMLSQTVNKQHNINSFVVKIMVEESENLDKSDNIALQNTAMQSANPVDVLMTQKLNLLAKARSSVVKNYLVTKGKVSKDRIFSCLPVPPKADDIEGPRVTFSF
ncbi:MAG: DUF748 domain-containing protein [Magnetococcales bacterium]|nr:DUF748 domain-containing protein [Magnetococcales bacterium]